MLHPPVDTLPIASSADLNLAFGWAWCLMGMVTGAVIGMKFQEEGFLGGYAARARRLVRLGHISFFGLGILNILFALSLARVDGASAAAEWGGVAMVVGGVAMPIACGLTAWRAALHPVFIVPVASLCAGAGAMLMALV